jgi:L-rhamnose mutarotase
MTLALRDDPAAIERYKEEHRHAWPEVLARLRGAGIEQMRIFLLGRRLFMYMETADGFDPARDFPRLNEDPTYRRWDELMRTMQEKVPEAGPGEWWAEMELVFDLGWG